MKYPLFFMVIVLFGSATNAQHPHFTQFYANPLYTNPALAGTGFRDEIAAGRVTANYRNQWNSTFNTFCLGWDQHFDKLHGGVGVQYIADLALNGLVNIHSLMVNYNSKFDIGKKTQLSLGIQAGRMNKSLNFNRVIFDAYYDYRFLDDFDGYYPYTTSIFYSNLNLGTMITQKNYYFGFSVFNVFTPNISFIQNPDFVLPRRISVQGGYSFSLSKNFILIPQVEYQVQQKASTIVIGLNANQNKLIYGLGFRKTRNQYRIGDAITGTIGYNFKGFRLIYSYDVAISDGRSAIPSSHELSLRYCWKTKQTGPKFCNALN